MSLINTIKLHLDPIHIQKVNQIDQFDFSKTAKKVNKDFDGLTMPYLQAGIENLKRYYVVALLDPLNKHAVSRFVDPFWHAHILHTRDYMDFCSSIFGQYVHHEPLDTDNIKEVAKVHQLYDYTRDIYHQMFHTIDENWWPSSTKVDYVHTFGPVCLHYHITNEEIRDKALFPKNIALAA